MAKKKKTSQRKRRAVRNQRRVDLAAEHGFDSWEDYQESLALKRLADSRLEVAKGRGFKSWEEYQAAKKRKTPSGKPITFLLDDETTEQLAELVEHINDMSNDRYTRSTLIVNAIKTYMAAVKRRSSQLPKKAELSRLA